jgi:hypothetical protein
MQNVFLHFKCDSDAVNSTRNLTATKHYTLFFNILCCFLNCNAVNNIAGGGEIT